MTAEYRLPRSRGQDPDVVAGRLWLAGAQGVWVRPDDIVGYFSSQEAPVPAGGMWADVPDTDWTAAWRAGIAPVAAGSFDVVPTWLADDHPEVDGRVRLLIDPGQAFGSGHHDTTLGCLEALASLDLDGRSVLDLGTGTGILAIAAARRGARPVVGVDTDPAAIEVARANLATNAVAVDLRVGSVGDVVGTFDVVVANLLTHTIVELAGDLVGAVSGEGRLVASGIGTARAAGVVKALSAAGLTDVAVRTRGEWAVVSGRRRRAQGC